METYITTDELAIVAGFFMPEAVWIIWVSGFWCGKSLSPLYGERVPKAGEGQAGADIRDSTGRVERRRNQSLFIQILAANQNTSAPVRPSSGLSATFSPHTGRRIPHTRNRGEPIISADGCRAAG